MKNKLPPLPDNAKLICEIPGFENYKGYAVDREGNVWSCNSQGLNMPFKDDWFLKAKKVAKDGYLACSLSYQDKAIYPKHHRLVALAFIPNPDNLPEVNHINGIKTDNRVANLEWCTHKYNMIHCIENNLRNTARGIRIKHAKLNDQLVVDIFRMRKSGMNQTEISLKMGCDPSDISRVLNRRTWAHVDVPAEYLL